MNVLPLVEKAEAYLHVQLSHSGPPASPVPAGPFVTLSRESGCGGSVLAAALAAQLPVAPGAHWTVYSGNLIEEMLRDNNLPPHIARYLPEDRISELDASVGEIVGLHPNLWALVRKTNELMRRLAHAGHTILLGRGANFATAALANGTHVRVVAPPAWRAQRTAENRGLSLAAAAGYNAARDAARRRYVRATFGADASAPAAYDLVVNLEHLAPAHVVPLIARLVALRVACPG